MKNLNIFLGKMNCISRLNSDCGSSTRHLDTMIAALVLQLGAIVINNAALAANSEALADRDNTPGAVRTKNTDAICQHGHTTRDARARPFLRHKVSAGHRAKRRTTAEYQIDWLIPAKLGGSNSPRNLWPQSYIAQPLNAYLKDQVENRLHHLVCSGKLRAGKAQEEIADDWPKAYVKYVGPLPANALPTTKNLVTPTVQKAQSQLGSISSPSRLSDCADVEMASVLRAISLSC